EEPHDELVSSRANPRRDLVGLHCQSPDGGRRNRPARTRGNAEAGGPEAVPRARAGVGRGRGPALAFHDGRSRCQIGSADPKGSKPDNNVGSYPHRHVSMVNTSCASRTPLSGCRPTDNNGSCTPSAACANELEIRIGFPNTLHNPSRRAASFTAGPIAVKLRRSAVPMLPYVTSPACNAMSK